MNGRPQRPRRERRTQERDARELLYTTLYGGNSGTVTTSQLRSLADQIEALGFQEFRTAWHFEDMKELRFVRTETLDEARDRFRTEMLEYEVAMRAWLAQQEAELDAEIAALPAPAGGNPPANPGGAQGNPGIGQANPVGGGLP